MGKTSLVNHWLNRAEQDKYRGAGKAYGWSFYSQGTSEDRQASADEFIAHALTWFGDPDPTQGSQWDRGVRLADLVRRQRTLLILDGMEPLQYPPGEMQGRLKDQGLQALLKELSRFNEGLCIITTRLAVTDLEHAVNSTVKNILLEHLSSEAGAKVLEKLGVKGTSDELKQASQEFKGHALALNLLGSYLAVVYDGDVRKRDLIPQLTEEEEHGGHARRVMESYEKCLSGKPELNILYIMGLFDRPVGVDAIESLKNEVTIKGLTVELKRLSYAEWQYALKRLRRLSLLAEKDETRSNTLDCHPLVRMHFGEQLRNNNTEAWKKAHKHLYEYYQNISLKSLPNTLEEMEPLFNAIKHACHAGRYQEALENIYWKKIKRKHEHYITRKLGAYSADLAVLSNFFESPWKELVTGLDDYWKPGILKWTGFNLWTFGRLEEAAQLLKEALEYRKRQKLWESAASILCHLSGLHLIWGNIKQAVEYAKQSVKFADSSCKWKMKMTALTILADASHDAGNLLEAGKLFQQAEMLQKEKQSKYQFLYSIEGFYFCDFLLTQGQYCEVQKRVNQTIEIAQKKDWLVDIALSNLSIGRAYWIQAQDTQDKGIKELTLSREKLNRVVGDIKGTGDQETLPLGLLARSALYRSQEDFFRAWKDLDETLVIAERGSMRLYLADYHLEASRLLKDQLSAKNYQISVNSEPVTITRQEMLTQLKNHFETAKQMVNEMGYHRRDKELESIEHELNRIKDYENVYDQRGGL
ncbi:MAG: hypothetical protein GY749_46420 [Desulfobacteraceae bacterium]|nr:hypothetical protein [Desulfobacteraceae bacterium]